MTAARKLSTREEWLSIGQAARALGESKFVVLSRIARGELVPQTVAQRTFVRRDSVDALIATRTEDTGRVA